MKRGFFAVNTLLALALVGVGSVLADWQAHAGGRPLSTVRAATVDASAWAGPFRSILMFEDFESPTSFVVEEGYAVTGPYPVGGSGAYWGRSLARAALGLFSAWCAADGPNAPGSLLYGADCAPYYGGPCLVPTASNSTMTAGPFDMSLYTEAELVFDLWLDTELNDPFSVQASVDSVSFEGFTYYGTSSGFTSMQLDLTSWPVLGDLTGQTEVWIRFGCSSDLSNRYEGAFIDNVLLKVNTGIFADGFETGDTKSWSRVVGGL